MVTPDLVANGLGPRRLPDGMGIEGIAIAFARSEAFLALEGACSGTFVISSRTT